MNLSCNQFYRISQNRIFRFVLVSGLNTSFGYGIFAFFIYLGIHYSLASILGTILGILFNFKTLGQLVFQNKNNSLVLKFFGVYGLTNFLSIGIIALFKKCGVNEYISGALLLLPMGVLAFILNNYWVFKERKSENIIN